MKPFRWGITIFLVALAILARMIPGPRTIDDAYITFRYARNLLSGYGFVYNPGEKVLGTTTPLYTLLLAGMGMLTGGQDADFSSLALAINTVADGITCLLLWNLGKKAGSSGAGLAAGILWAIAPFSVTFAIGGMETSLVVCLLTGGVWAFLERRYALTGSLGALAFLTRVDTTLLFAPLGLFWVIQALRGREKMPLRAIVAAGLPVALWLIFSITFFGNPIPQSVQAKILAYRLEPGAALIRLLQHYATPFMDYNLLGYPASVMVGLFLYPFLALVGTFTIFRREPRFLPYLLYPWLYFVAFALPNPLIFRWYLTPPLPVWIFLIFFGGARVISSLSKRRWVILGVGATLTGLAMVSMLLDWRWHPDHGPTRPAPDMAYIQLELLYKEAAQWVKEMAQPGDTLAAGDVGVLGFDTNLRILDLVGLNSPIATRYYPLNSDLYVINYAVSPRLILDTRPDWVVILEVYGRRGLLREPKFLQEYHLVKTIETDMYGSKGLLIFSRKP
ncbi:MAG TPA: hypothetical protein DEQ80_08585 [Anaerolinea thermolimosa]|uniref:Glycosyltransferase RgtA/B/C/D-like domain-containing protein n=1 Tax=Anaerolinea thermolimosa TaxID=229919 RepID=A0A3D1JH33_9CHLR|nr:hypothetical protein [Anaerolinea thermolimosa]